MGGHRIHLQFATGVVESTALAQSHHRIFVAGWEDRKWNSATMTSSNRIALIQMRPGSFAKPASSVGRFDAQPTEGADLFHCFGFACPPPCAIRRFSRHRAQGGHGHQQDRAELSVTRNQPCRSSVTSMAVTARGAPQRACQLAPPCSELPGAQRLVTAASGKGAHAASSLAKAAQERPARRKQKVWRPRPIESGQACPNSRVVATVHGR